MIKNRKSRNVPRNPSLLRRCKGAGFVDARRAPDWWVSASGEVERFMRSLRGIEVVELGRSAGNRPILAATWGEREDLPDRTSASLGSAMAASSPEAFYGKGKRLRQGFTFLGGIHGTEIEGSVAALNFLNVVVSGRDLRGKRWPRLAREGRKLRIVVIPHFNIDGRARFDHIRHIVGAHPDENAAITMGIRKDGTPMKWPACKARYPIPLQEMEQLGSFYNDAGYELSYAHGFGEDLQPENRALGAFLMEEMPDAVLCSHTDHGSLVQPPATFIPEHFRNRVSQMGALVGSRCQRDGLKKHSIPSRLHAYGHPRMVEADRIYHTCGALPFLVEFPCGYQNCPDNHDDILDIGLTVIEEIVAFGNAYRFRPDG